MRESPCEDQTHYKNSFQTIPPRSLFLSFLTKDDDSATLSEYRIHWVRWPTWVRISVNDKVNSDHVITYNNHFLIRWHRMFRVADINPVSSPLRPPTSLALTLFPTPWHSYFSSLASRPLLLTLSAIYLDVSVCIDSVKCNLLCSIGCWAL